MNTGEIHCKVPLAAQAVGLVYERNSAYIQAVLKREFSSDVPLTIESLFLNLTYREEGEGFYYDFNNNRGAHSKNNEPRWRTGESSSLGINGERVFTHINPSDLGEATKLINLFLLGFQKKLFPKESPLDEKEMVDDLINDILRVYVALDFAHIPIDGAGRFNGEVLQLLFQMIQHKFPIVNDEYIMPILSPFRGCLIEEDLFQRQIAERSTIPYRTVNIGRMRPLFTGGYRQWIHRLQRRWKHSSEILRIGLPEKLLDEKVSLEDLSKFYKSISGKISDGEWAQFMEVLSSSPLYNDNYVYSVNSDFLNIVLKILDSDSDSDIQDETNQRIKTIMSLVLRDRLESMMFILREHSNFIPFSININLSTSLEEIESVITQLISVVDLMK